MKLLKSRRNDFPDYYVEYSLNDLGKNPLRPGDVTDPRPGPRPEVGGETLVRLELLETDIREIGLTHPIIIWAHKIVGHQRIWIAKKLGYTHISAYQVRDREGYDKVRIHTISDEYWKKQR